jgi:hypothetical protein
MALMILIHLAKCRDGETAKPKRVELWDFKFQVRPRARYNIS